MKLFKYLLLPITMLIWAATVYYGIYYSLVLMLWMFYLNWLWIIIGYTFLIGAISSITNAIPNLLRLLILGLYGFNWFSIIIHSLAGLIGLILTINFFNSNPIEYVSGNNVTPLLTGMWESSPLKTIVLFLPFCGLILSIPYATIISPIIIKIRMNRLENVN